MTLSPDAYDRLARIAWVHAPPEDEEADDEVATFLTDASRYPGGSAPRVYLPTSEGEVAWVLQHEERVLPVGAQSSLTGGAAPQGDAVLATLPAVNRGSGTTANGNGDADDGTAIGDADDEEPSAAAASKVVTWCGRGESQPHALSSQKSQA